MIMMFGDWKPISVGQIPRIIHHYYEPDASVDRVRRHDETGDIMLEFDPETVEKIGDIIHVWSEGNGAWTLTKKL